jgi:hypothetical protein
MINGYWMPQAVYCMAKLGLAWLGISAQTGDEEPQESSHEAYTPKYAP